MFNLIIKDISFNIKNVFLGLLAVIVFSMVIVDGSRFALVAIMMCPSLLFSLSIGKMCNKEDNKSVYHFLNSLPIKREDIVRSKFVESYLVLIVSFSMLMLINIVLKATIGIQYNLFSTFSLIVNAVLIIYNSTYLFLNFKFSNANAQQAVFVLVILYLGIIKGADFLKGIFGQTISLTSTVTSTVLLVCSFIFSLVLMKLSVKAYLNKE